MPYQVRNLNFEPIDVLFLPFDSHRQTLSKEMITLPLRLCDIDSYLELAAASKSTY